MSNFVFAETTKHATLLFNLSEAEIGKLIYERYVYPDPMVQKRILAVYLKATLGWNNSIIDHAVGIALQCGRKVDKSI